ncbi:MAG TPA: hut operon positive regulator HutP, partial [Thermoanaerobacterales bacterium]|nr:hut operon positive regulator HutP [Thermoanaerobacterales bacterium]
AIGFNVGGKIGIARCGEHLSVAMFFAVGFVNLNEVVVGLGHRSLPNSL